MLVAFLWWIRAGLWVLDMMAQFLCWATGQEPPPWEQENE